jgi:ribosomal protein S18 acetylase RimI-like enzyme/catechol 2,3-dioxygenase-like lactoylglutathione lyase family enzyme
MRKPPATALRGLFEAHLHVLDLERSMRFYGDVLGLELGRHEPERRAAFYWVGENRRTMLGLWEAPPWIIDGTGNVVRTQHLAFGVELKDLNGTIQHLRNNGIELKNFFDEITEEPSVFSWIPAASIYFHDIDGHLLEFIAKMDDQPAPHIGTVSLSEWNALSRQESSRAMTEASSLEVIIRRVVADDVDGITRTYLESAEHHASLDPELYFVPAFETIAERYREGRQHPQDGCENITLVAQLNSEVVGFIDARLFHSLDAMHRQITYCHVSEIAVRRQHQNQGIGAQLLRAAQEWGHQQGAECAVLEYHVTNTRAGAFYHQQMGYRVTSITMVKHL